MWLKILPTTCQHAFFLGCLGGGALFTTADFHLLFLPFPNELVHWASLPAKEPKSSKRKGWGKSMSITHHKQRNNNDVWENKRFDIFGWKYGVNFSHIFPQRSTQIDSCSASEVSPDLTLSRSCHRWDWSWKPRSKPVLVLLVGRWHQTNKQESKANGTLIWFIMAPLLKITVYEWYCSVWWCQGFYVQVGQPQHLWRFFVGQCICLCALSNLIFYILALSLAPEGFYETFACLAFRSIQESDGIGLCRQIVGADPC